MKKILICLLCLVMLAGCGTSGKKDDDRDDKRKDYDSVLELDTSPEETTEELTTEPSIPFDTSLCGSWAHYREIDGYEYVIHLTINEDGTAEYKTGIAFSEYSLIFAGTWNDDGGTLNFVMRGGQTQADIENELIELDKFEGSFNWSSIGGNLLLNYASGNDFDKGIPGEPYNFTRM